MQGRTRGTETSHYPQEKKTKCDSHSSGELRTGKSPKPLPFRRQRGSWEPRDSTEDEVQITWKGKPVEGDSPVHDTSFLDSGIPSRGGTREILPEFARTSWQGLNTPRETDSEPVPRGKGEKYPEQGG